MTTMFVLPLLLVSGSMLMVSAENTDYVIIPPAMSMDDFNTYVSITVPIITKREYC